MRVDASSKRRLEDAATEMHLSVSAFVLHAAQALANQVLAERQVIRLSPEAAVAFDEALARPAEVNDRLVAALQRPARFSWLD